MSLQETFAKDANTRPSVAIGHVRLLVSSVPQATNFFLQIGLRYITQSEKMAVLELRGGTHLVLRETSELIAPGTNASFDLMVDDVFATRDAFIELGLNVAEIATGRVHSSFVLTGPDAYLITVTSSHTGGREV